MNRRNKYPFARKKQQIKRRNNFAFVEEKEFSFNKDVHEINMDDLRTTDIDEYITAVAKNGNTQLLMKSKMNNLEPLFDFDVPSPLEMDPVTPVSPQGFDSPPMNYDDFEAPEFPKNDPDADIEDGELQFLFSPEAGYGVNRSYKSENERIDEVISQLASDTFLEEEEEEVEEIMKNNFPSKPVIHQPQRPAYNLNYNPPPQNLSMPQTNQNMFQPPPVIRRNQMPNQYNQQQQYADTFYPPTYPPVQPQQPQYYYPPPHQQQQQYNAQFNYWQKPIYQQQQQQQQQQEKKYRRRSHESSPQPNQIHAQPNYYNNNQNPYSATPPQQKRPTQFVTPVPSPKKEMPKKGGPKQKTSVSLMKKHGKVRVISMYNKKIPLVSQNNSFPWDAQGGIVLENVYDCISVFEVDLGSQGLTMEDISLNYKLFRVGYFKNDGIHLLKDPEEMRGKGGASTFFSQITNKVSSRKRSTKKKAFFHNPLVQVRDGKLRVEFRLNNYDKGKTKGINHFVLEVSVFGRIFKRLGYYFKKDNRKESRAHIYDRHASLYLTPMNIYNNNNNNGNMNDDNTQGFGNYSQFTMAVIPGGKMSKDLKSVLEKEVVLKKEENMEKVKEDLLRATILRFAGLVSDSLKSLKIIEKEIQKMDDNKNKEEEEDEDEIELERKRMEAEINEKNVEIGLFSKMVKKCRELLETYVSKKKVE